VHSAEKVVVSRPSWEGAPSANRRNALKRDLLANKKSGDNLQVLVRDNNVDQALRVLKKKLQREGVFREMKTRRAFEKPSEKRAREKAEAVRRARKAARKLAQREGIIAGGRKR
jgi:small subunit ribosomal protein S21